MRHVGCAMTAKLITEQQAPQLHRAPQASLQALLLPKIA